MLQNISNQLDPEFSQAWIEQANILQQQGRHLESEKYITEYVITCDKRAENTPSESQDCASGEVNTYAIGHLGNLPLVYIMAQN